MTISKHQTYDFLGTQGSRYSRCVTIPGLPGDYSYFAPVPNVTGNFLSRFELFEAWFVFRQRNTPTVSIEFSKEVKYSVQKEEISPKKASKKKTTQSLKNNCFWRKTSHPFFACCAVVRLRRNRPFFFAYGELGPAQKSANRTMTSARGEKNGI